MFKSSCDANVLAETAETGAFAAAATRDSRERLRRNETVTVNGAAAPALFVGLTPYTVGLYQIDFTVPMGTPDGNQVLTVSQAGAVSNVTILPVHQ